MAEGILTPSTRFWTARRLQRPSSLDQHLSCCLFLPSCDLNPHSQHSVPFLTSSSFSFPWEWFCFVDLGVGGGASLRLCWIAFRCYLDSSPSSLIWVCIHDVPLYQALFFFPLDIRRIFSLSQSALCLPLLSAHTLSASGLQRMKDTSMVPLNWFPSSARDHLLHVNSISLLQASKLSREFGKEALAVTVIELNSYLVKIPPPSKKSKIDQTI